MSKWVWCISMLRKLKYKGKHNAELAIWVYRHKQEKINQNKNFKCAKAAVSWVKRHRSCWYEGQCSISWYNNVLQDEGRPRYFARILADRHAEISSLFLMRQITLSTDRFSILQCQVIRLYWACFPVSFWTNQFSFFEILHQSMNCFGRSNLKSQNPVAIFTKTYQPYFSGDSLK